MPILNYVPAPIFSAPTHARPDFAFSSLGGMFVLLVFLPDKGPERVAAEAALARSARLFDDVTRTAFGVVRNAEDFASLKPRLPGMRYFHDRDGAIARMYGVEGADGSTVGQWVLIDPTQRIISSRPLLAWPATLAEIRGFDDVETHSGGMVNAPVLTVPRVFEPDFCRRLIDVYKADGGDVSGVMREVNGRTVGVVNDFKKRWDADIQDEGLKQEIQKRIRSRLLPEIAKSFMFKATRMERYIVARYDAVDGGYFKPHRDNTTRGTAHRQFACSINLNTEEFEGGDLRFPEFGRKTYRPPTGGAVIFSCALLHEATPVTNGTRYAFLPFFYNDAMAKVREENAAYLDLTPPVRQLAKAAG